MKVQPIKLTPMLVYKEIYNRYIMYNSINKKLTEIDVDKLSREANKLAVKTTWITYNILKKVYLND